MHDHGPRWIKTLRRGLEVIEEAADVLGPLVRKLSRLIVVTFAVGAWGSLWMLTDSYDRYLAWRHLRASVEVVASDADATSELRLPSGARVEATATGIATQPHIVDRSAQVRRAVYLSLALSAASVLSLFALLMWLICRIGAAASRREMSERVVPGVVRAAAHSQPLRSLAGPDGGHEEPVDHRGHFIEGVVVRALERSVSSAPVQSELALGESAALVKCEAAEQVQRVVAAHEDGLVFGAQRQSLRQERGRRGRQKAPSRRSSASTPSGRSGG